jgi:hypothetical protein
MVAKPLELRAVSSFIVKRGTAIDHNASPPVVGHTVTQLTLPSKWSLSTWFWSVHVNRVLVLVACCICVCVSCFHPPLDRVLAMTQEVPVRDTVSFKTVRCITPQPRRHCWEYSSYTHLQYILIAGYCAAVAPRGMYAAHMSLFGRPWRLYNELAIAGRFAGLIPIHRYLDSFFFFFLIAWPSREGL